MFSFSPKERVLRITHLASPPDPPSSLPPSPLPPSPSLLSRPRNKNNRKIREKSIHYLNNYRERTYFSTKEISHLAIPSSEKTTNLTRGSKFCIRSLFVKIQKFSRTLKMKVKIKSADGCARTRANGVVAASLRVACPAMNREPRKSVEPVATGSCKKRPLCESGVRMVELRCDDQLRTTKKVLQNLNCVKIGGLSTAKLHKKCSSVREMQMNMNDHRGCHFLDRELTYLQEPVVESSVSRTRKRTFRLLSSSPDVQNTTGAYTKVSTTEKVGGSKDFFQERPSKLLKKVDAVASPHALLGEKCMHTSFKDKNTGNSERGGEHDRPILDARYIPLRRIDCYGAETSECSVASCSTSNYPSHNLSHQYNAYCRQEMDGCFDDAASCILGHRKECSFPSKEEIVSKIHKLELHAYRSTLEALHASGPLSWEQEALMTNLRLNLNISNDEHLLELRKLVSSQSF